MNPRLRDLQLGRRPVLQLGLAGIAALAFGSGPAPLAHAETSASASDDFAVLRANWLAIAGAPGIDASDPAYSGALSALGTSASSASSTMLTDATRTALWADLPLGTKSANMTASFARLRTIAFAAITPGVAGYDSAVYKAQVADGLSWLCTGIYAPGATSYDNGWDWEIGVGQHLTDCGVFLHDYFTPAQLSTYAAALDTRITPTALNGATGGNLTDLCQIMVNRATFDDDAAKVTTAVTALSTGFDYVTSGDGLYADGSFVQHSVVAYSGTYGAIFLRGVAQMVATVAGTGWAVTDPSVENVYDAALTAFAPLIFHGLMADSVRGRALTRAGEPDAANAVPIAQALCHIADALGTDPRAMTMRGIAKGIFTRATSWPVLDHGSLPVLATAVPLLADTAVPTAEESVQHRQYPSMERTVHRRPGWMFSISLCSHRIAYYESINGENRTGWNTGQGMTQLYLDSDNSQYNDLFWQSVDWVKLPGTTVQTITRAPGRAAGWRPATVWSGGSVLDARYGAVGWDVQGIDSSLTGKKAWFCFDEYVLALGAGLTASAVSGAWVNTIVENRKVSATTVTVNGATQLASPSTGTTAFAGTRWAHLSDVAGYVFPTATAIKGIRQTRSSGTGTPSRDFVTLFVDHGGAPANATYAYLLVPKATPARTLELSTAFPLSILANTNAVQGAYEPQSGVRMANFYSAGSAGNITSSGSASVVTQTTSDGLRVAVSDPSRTTSTVRLTITGEGYTSSSLPDGVSVISQGNPVVVDVTLAGRAGSSVAFSFSR